MRLLDDPVADSGPVTVDLDFAAGESVSLTAVDADGTRRRLTVTVTDGSVLLFGENLVMRHPVCDPRRAVAETLGGDPQPAALDVGLNRFAELVRRQIELPDGLTPAQVVVAAGHPILRELLHRDGLEAVLVPEAVPEAASRLLRVRTPADALRLIAGVPVRSKRAERAFGKSLLAADGRVHVRAATMTVAARGLSPDAIADVLEAADRTAGAMLTVPEATAAAAGQALARQGHTWHRDTLKALVEAQGGTTTLRLVGGAEATGRLDLRGVKARQVAHLKERALEALRRPNGVGLVAELHGHTAGNLTLRVLDCDDAYRWAGTAMHNCLGTPLQAEQRARGREVLVAVDPQGRPVQAIEVNPDHEVTQWLGPRNHLPDPAAVRPVAAALRGGGITTPDDPATGLFDGEPFELGLD